MTPEQYLAVFLALLGGEMNEPTFPELLNGGPDPRFPVTLAPCTRPVAPSEIDGQTVVCGTISVPEDHDSPDGDRLNLAFIVYRAHSLAPVADPVVYLHGGPGGGTVQSVASVSLFFDHLRGRRDVIAFDQRGVDASGPDMDCFETLAENVEDVADSLAGAEMPELEGRLVSECILELEGRGFDLPLFNTTQNARDVGSVMSALGYGDYNIYGVSYGTKLALETMRTAPDRVRSVVLDSVAPPQVALYDTLYVPHSQSIINTFAPCEANAICAEAYPEISQRFWDLAEQLQDTPLEVDGTTVDGRTLFSIFTAARNNWADPTTRGFTTYAPALVTQLEQGDVTMLRQMLQEAIPPQPSAEDALAGAIGLTSDEQALAQAFVNALDQIELASGTAAQMLAQLEEDIDAAAAPVTFGEYFDDELERALAALPERSDQVAFSRDYLSLRFVTPSAGALIDLVRTHFDDLTAARLSSMIALLGADDVARVFDLIAVDNATLEAVAEGEFELLLYACQEDFIDGFNSAEGFVKTTESVGMGPLLASALTDPLPSMFTICDLFEERPRDNWLEPVTSDLPVLVFSGEIDTQTASSWGPLVAETLPNSQAIVFPEAGHGALLFSQCARDIGEAFLEAPGSTIDTSCASDLRLPYLMPDGSLLDVR